MMFFKKTLIKIFDSLAKEAPIVVIMLLFCIAVSAFTYIQYTDSEADEEKYIELMAKQNEIELKRLESSSQQTAAIHSIATIIQQNKKLLDLRKEYDMQYWDMNFKSMHSKLDILIERENGSSK